MQASEELGQNAVPTRPGDQSVEFPIKLDEVADICTFGSRPNRIEIGFHPIDFGTSRSFRRPARRLRLVEEPHLDCRNEVVETDRRYDDALARHDLDEAFD